jgi:hypothetical protein
LNTRDSEELISTRGLVIEEDWDEESNPICIKLETYSENQYLIKMNRMGRRLLRICGSVVDVTGVGSIDKSGRRWISVKSFFPSDVDDEYSVENGLSVGRYPCKAKQPRTYRGDMILKEKKGICYEPSVESTN